jgi:hypothetical protein
MRSAALSEFWGQPVSIDAHILLPDSYYKESQRRYPIIYWIQGFGGRGQIDLARELQWQKPMRAQHVEYIIVFLNGMFNQGHQEFADSANNGPWGTALLDGIHSENRGTLSRNWHAANAVRRRTFLGRMVGALAAGHISRPIRR